MTSIQTTGSHDNLIDEFSFTMCFGDSPALTFEGLTREQVSDMRDCLDAMLWHEQDSSYSKTFDGIQATLDPYVSLIGVEEATKETIETVRALLLCKVDFDDGNDLAGTLHWPEIEAMFTRPLNY